MGDVFRKRCGGCNAILKQRESCPTCAERVRAELHAAQPMMRLWDEPLEQPPTSGRHMEAFMRATQESMARLMHETSRIDAKLWAADDVVWLREYMGEWVTEPQEKPPGAPPCNCPACRKGLDQAGSVLRGEQPARALDWSNWDCEHDGHQWCALCLGVDYCRLCDARRS